MRERLGSGPRIVRALFAAILVLGIPIAIALPTDLNSKVYALGAVVLIAAAAAILAAALLRRREGAGRREPRWRAAQRAGRSFRHRPLEPRAAEAAGMAPLRGAVHGLLRSARLNHDPGAHSSSKRRSEEHTSELQSPCNLVCRLLLEKKK